MPASHVVWKTVGCDVGGGWGCGLGMDGDVGVVMCVCCGCTLHVGMTTTGCERLATCVIATPHNSNPSQQQPTYDGSYTNMSGGRGWDRVTSHTTPKPVAVVRT